MKVRLRFGDCRQVLKRIPDAKIHSIVTDPPYEIGFLNRKWDTKGIAYASAVWSECLRVLKPGGFLLAFGGTRTYHRMVCAIENAGFTTRDTIAWHYAQGMPKGIDVQLQINKKAGKKGYEGKWKGFTNQIKPATELILIAQKPFKGTITDNLAKHNTGVMNIDACRVGNNKPKVSSKKFNPHAYSGGFKHRSKEQTQFNTDIGRYPSNLIHDGSPQIVSLFPAKAGGGHWAKTKVTGFGKFGSGKSEYHGSGEKDGFGSASRFFKSCTFSDLDFEFPRFVYCAKTSRRERNEGLNEKNTHVTVKPLELMRYLVRLVTPPGGWCLDPFLGSGTTGIASILEGFNFYGIELDSDHFAIAKGRMRHARNGGFHGETQRNDGKANTGKVHSASVPGREVRSDQKRKIGPPQEGWQAHLEMHNRFNTHGRRSKESKA